MLTQLVETNLKMLYYVALSCLVVLATGKPYHGYEQPDYTLEKYQPAVS